MTSVNDIIKEVNDLESDVKKNSSEQTSLSASSSSIPYIDGVFSFKIISNLLFYL